MLPCCCGGGKFRPGGRLARPSARLSVKPSGRPPRPPAPPRPAGAVLGPAALAGRTLGARAARDLRGAPRVAAAGRLLLALLAAGGLGGRAAGHRAHGGRHARDAAAEHGLHLLLALEEVRDQLGDLADGDAGSLGDAGPPGAVDDLRVAPFLRGHGPDDGLRAVQVLVVDLGQQLPVLGRAGQHAEQVPDRPELADHGQLLDEILEREALARGDPAGQVGGLVGVEGLLGLLDQGEDVTEVEDPRRHPVRVEQVEVLELLPRRREHDRPAGQLHDGQRGAAPGVAVELGQDHAVVTDPVQEGLRGGHRVLADHRVDHEQDLVRLGGVPDRAGLGHHLLVDAQPAGGVDDDHVVLAAPGLLQRLPRDGDRVAHAVTRLRGVHRDSGALAEHLELLDGVGPLQVGGDQHRRVALPLEPQRELGRQRGLTGALQAGQHDDGRRHLREPQPPGLAARGCRPVPRARS